MAQRPPPLPIPREDWEIIGTILGPETGDRGGLKWKDVLRLFTRWGYDVDTGGGATFRLKPSKRTGWPFPQWTFARTDFTLHRPHERFVPKGYLPQFRQNLRSTFGWDEETFRPETEEEEAARRRDAGRVRDAEQRRIERQRHVEMQGRGKRGRKQNRRG
ncbi:hypothetical protein BD309DRAFT_984860 [Dichomitus squalens]|nr:hypothetical protein BD309DRAFT_984860 [Dichomitus squalens]